MMELNTIRRIRIMSLVFNLLLTLSGVCASANNTSSQEDRLILYGTENSGGGGSPIVSSKEQIEKIMLEFMSFIKEGETFNVARFFYGPYSRLLTKLTQGESMINGNSLGVLLDLNRVNHNLSIKEKRALVVFVETFSTESQAYFPDHNSFLEYFDHERLKKEMEKVDLNFADCAKKYNLPGHKMASYFYNQKTQRGELCFYSEGLTQLGSTNIEVQLSSLFVHELIHIYHEKNHERKILLTPSKDQKRSQAIESSAQSLQEEFFNYYSIASITGSKVKIIQTIITQILKDSEKACSNDSMTLHSSLIKTKLLTLLLDSYDIPVTAYIKKFSPELMVLRISEFLSHFKKFRSQENAMTLERLKENYCAPDVQNIIFNDFMTTFFKSMLTKLQELQFRADSIKINK